MTYNSVHNNEYLKDKDKKQFLEMHTACLCWFHVVFKNKFTFNNLWRTHQIKCNKTILNVIQKQNQEKHTIFFKYHELNYKYYI